LYSLGKLNMWNLLIQPLVGLVSTHLNNKAEAKQAVHKSNLKKIESESSWENNQSINANNSWKDEWFTVILSIPLIGAFVPEMVPYIKEGFITLQEMPDFYKGFLGAAMAASFGIKSLAKWGERK
jgi:hypothetical protein